MISSASPKRPINTTAEANKSPKTGGHVELEDADLLDYDKDDALSTVHEVGLEEDLEDPEIQDSLQFVVAWARAVKPFRKPGADTVMQMPGFLVR